MAITLFDVFIDTASNHNLKLVAGSKGMKGILKWVYVTEDPENAPFLQGGELVITTGLFAKNDPLLLVKLAKTMSSKGACGMIVNVGKYICNLPQDLIDYCEQQNFPLFTMPWETYIYNISRDYCERLFIDRQIKLEISKSFKELLQKKDISKNMSILENHDLPINSEWFVASVRFGSAKFSMNQLLFSIENFVIRCGQKCHCQIYNSDIVLIFNGDNTYKPKEFIEHLSSSLGIVCENNFLIGCGEGVLLSSIFKSYLQSQVSISFSCVKNANCVFFETLDFYRILFSVEDTELLQSFVDEQLGEIINYDKNHNTNYTETLNSFIVNSGNIKSMSEELYCHRNTVNYRLQILKNNFKIDLESSMDRFHLMAAFFIREYLEIVNPKSDDS